MGMINKLVIRYFFRVARCCHHKYEPFPNDWEFRKRNDVPKLSKWFILLRWQLIKYKMVVRVLFISKPLHNSRFQ